MDALGGEYFDFDADKLRLIGERSREVIGIGTPLTVEVLDVDLLRRQIAFGRVASPTKKASSSSKAPAKRDAGPPVSEEAPRPRREDRPEAPKRGSAARGRPRGIAVEVDGDAAIVDASWKPQRRQPARSGDDRSPAQRERVAGRGEAPPVKGIKGPDDLRALFERGGPPRGKPKGGAAGKPGSSPRGSSKSAGPSSSKSGQKPKKR